MQRGGGTVRGSAQERPDQAPGDPEGTAGVLREPGVDDARMQGVDRHRHAREPARQGVGEQHIAELGLRIGPQRAVGAFGLQVVEGDAAAGVGGRGHVDDAGRGTGAAGGLQQVEQFESQQHVAEVVERPGALEPVRASLPPVEDRAGIIHQHVEPRIGRADLGRQPADLGLRRQVGDEAVDRRAANRRAQRLGAGIDLAHVAPDDPDAGAGLRQAQGGLVADAGGGTGDEDDPVPQARRRRHGLRTPPARSRRRSPR